MGRTTVHRLWKAMLAGFLVLVVIACVWMPAVLAVIAVAALLLAVGRLFYRGRDRYIPNLYARDVRIYDDSYRAFLSDTMAKLRKRKINGHTLLHEAAQMDEPSPVNADELLLDLGVWIGWSTRLVSETSGRKVYGFDTFSGLVEDWQIDDQVLVKSGSFALSEPYAQRFIRETGVTLDDGVPSALGRNVQFIKGSTYDTLVPFLDEHPAAPIRLFHMDLDTYESCLHALEACKDHFVEGSILVFDEYLVTNGELRAFYEFQERYGLQWRYRAWGLEMMELNSEMVVTRWRRWVHYLLAISNHWLTSGNSYVWNFLSKPFWRFWLGAPIGDIVFMLGAAGQRKSVSVEITGLGALGRAA